MRWLTSDYHLGETRFELMNRPFSDTEEMISVLIKNHNNLVAPNDTVYILGDVCYQKHPEYLPRIAEFNGKKILVRGNHDRVIQDSDFSKYFEEIIPDGKGIEIDIDKIPCYLTHYPSEGRKDRFNLVGHVHHTWRFQLNMFNVGIDANHFRPVDIKTIPFHFKSICEYYDLDVFAGYSPINSEYIGKRGRNSIYFKG
jgi:calcineurin-like phosphoesterase family protein